jgi:predicted ferric reductase
MLLREIRFYLTSGLIGLLVYAACYSYLRWLGIPGEVNKAAADTAIILMGFSMLQSGLSYFFNLFDRIIIYRKYFGLTGFAFAITHLVLSWGAFMNLLRLETWMKGAMLPALTGTLAFVIFTIMASISNTFFTKLLGSEAWRRTLRTGYLAVIFVLAHVVLLKYGRWTTWYLEGMQTPPSLIFIFIIFLCVLLVMRLLLWFSLRNKRR